MKPYLYPEENIKQQTVTDRTLILALVLIFGILMILFSLLEIRASKREMVKVMNEQSSAVMLALQKGSENAVTSFALVEELLAEKLLSIARLVERLDYEKTLTRQEINEIAQENNIFRINIFDAKGNRFLSNAPGNDGKNRGSSSEHLLELLQNNDELLMGFRTSRFGTGDRFAVAKKRRNGGVIILNIDAAEMQEFRKAIGAGKLVKDIGESKGIVYVVLQDSAGILLASQAVDSLLSPAEDPFIINKVWPSQTPQTRFTTFHNKTIFEVLQAVSGDKKREIFRIGFDTANLQQLESSSQKRTVLAALLFLMLGVFISTRVIGKQNYNKLQETLNTMETYTGSILANMTEAVIAMESSGKITIFNNAAEQLFNIKIASALGADCHKLLTPICPVLESVFENRKDFNHPALKVKVKDNEERILAVGITVLQNKELSSLTLFAVIKDVTEQKRLEENLARKDQISAMGHLASGVAHEIRNPLNAISIIAQRFKNEFTPIKDREEFEQLATTVVNETQRINSIIGQFLQFAKPEKLLKTRVNITELVEEVALIASQQANNKGIVVEINCPVLPSFYGDGNKLKQAFLNLVLNSIQACQKGNHVKIVCEKADKQLFIHVIDNGKGIPENNLDKIFNLYFTTREEGTGIGLSIVQQIISLHEGVIHVKSKPGEGTTFTIQIPYKEENVGL